MNFKRLLISLFFISFCWSTISAQSSETEVIYLSGKGNNDTKEWDFFCTEGRKSGEWTKIAVPSCWEQQGFGSYCYGVNFYGKATAPGISTEQGLYKHTFNVPQEWKGKTVRLVFEGVMTDARVIINGSKAGDVHQGGFYRFSYNITNYLKYGADNLLEVSVKKESEEASVNLAERRGDYWNFGGIFRPVFLQVMPDRYIDRVAIDADADGSFTANLFLGEAYGEQIEAEATLIDANGKKIGTKISSEAQSGSDMISLSSHFYNIKQWTPESPNLYTVEFVLKIKGVETHKVSERIGFRTIEVREGDGFYVNGSKVNMRGVNRHSFRSETGRTLNREQNFEDVRLIKEMNMNTVRLSHYPADPDFLDACDELGLYVLNEIGGWHGRYNTGVGRKVVRETVTRDVNHPSVVFWDNGNEGGWNTELDREFHIWDPQKRPVLHPQQDLSGVETMHYRSYGETQEYLRGEMVFFPTEFLHGLYDGGHGAGLYDYWNMMYSHPRCAGGLLWVLSDEGIMRTDLGNKIDNDGNHGADGIVGPNHEREGSFYTIKEVWCPVHIDMDKLPDNFNGEITVENRYDFTNLNQCKFQWKLLKIDQSGETFAPSVVAEGTASSPDVKPRNSGMVKVPSDFKNADILHLTAIDGFGKELWTWSWNLSKQEAMLDSDSKTQKVTTEFNGYYQKVFAGNIELRFNRETGLLVEVLKGGKKISFGNGPRFVACRRADRSPDGWIAEYDTKGINHVYNDISGESKLTGIQVETVGNDVVIESKYFGQLVSTRWTIAATGEIRLDYTYRYDGVVELMGIQFDYPESKMKSIKWLGDGPYRVWQNRLHGTTFNIWENKYNDPVPGESFVYPEFKGFFGNWRRAEFNTSEGCISIATQSSDNYLGVYSPRDGRDAQLFTFPQMGISVLDVIPAVRNKVNTTDLIGPSSQAHHVSGERSGTLWFAF